MYNRHIMACTSLIINEKKVLFFYYKKKEKKNACNESVHGCVPRYQGGMARERSPIANYFHLTIPGR